jgi:uncharacterized PurR-regulated membrane protein YhhQ (DUF165 family)
MNKAMLSANISEGRTKYFTLIGFLYIASIVISITLSTKLFSSQILATHFSLHFTGGTLVIPLAFFIQDISTEVYGYAKSRRLVQIASIFLLIYLVSIETIGHIAAFRPSGHTFYYTVVHNLAKHVLAFIAASFGGTVINDYLISKLKIYFSGKYLIARFIFSTMVGEAFYQMIGFLLWVYYLDSVSQTLMLIIFSYIYRILFEAATSPISYVIALFLKHSEGIDTYDNKTNYNPFLWR